MPPLLHAARDPQRSRAKRYQKGFLSREVEALPPGDAQGVGPAGTQAPGRVLPDPPPRSLAADLGLIRCLPSLRALLVLMCMLRLLSAGPSPAPGLTIALLVSSVYAAGLLWSATRGEPDANASLWPWVDSALLVWLGQLDPPAPSLFTVLLVVPVVLLTLQRGIAHGVALAGTAGLALLWLTSSAGPETIQPWQAVVFPAGLLVLGPAAALLVRPEQAQRHRRALMEELAHRTTPRHGLTATVEVLLQVLASHTRGHTVLLSLSGPQPRVFAHCAHRAGIHALPDLQADALRGWLRSLPCDQAVWLRPLSPAGLESRALALDSGRLTSRFALDLTLAQGLEPAVGSGAVVLPLVSYGQAHGHLVVGGLEARGTLAMWQLWQAMAQDALPLVERADLLEQLENEAVAHERARIGRDLHDSAVQPYLGLKYGIEALLRRTAPDNPVAADVRSLLDMASAELEGLRDLVSGLRSGRKPGDGEDPLLPALERQARRLRMLFGIEVLVRAAEVPTLRRSVAQAVFHMVNEALNNARRHTQAHRVEIELKVIERQLKLCVRNDHGGRAMAPTAFHPRSLSERAQAFGGQVEVSTQADQTDIVITMPLDAEMP
jgi:signal transduction histidine kinase